MSGTLLLRLGSACLLLLLLLCCTLANESSWQPSGSNKQTDCCVHNDFGKATTKLKPGQFKIAHILKVLSTSEQLAEFGSLQPRFLLQPSIALITPQLASIGHRPCLNGTLIQSKEHSNDKKLHAGVIHSVESIDRNCPCRVIISQPLAELANVTEGEMIRIYSAVVLYPSPIVEQHAGVKLAPIPLMVNQQAHFNSMCGTKPDSFPRLLFGDFKRKVHFPVSALVVAIIEDTPSMEIHLLQTQLMALSLSAPYEDMTVDNGVKEVRGVQIRINRNGHLLQDDEGVVISRSVAEELNVDMGQYIILVESTSVEDRLWQKRMAKMERMLFQQQQQQQQQQETQQPHHRRYPDPTYAEL